MLTPSYAATATERVLPRLALDFTAGVLDPRVTVARALNTATRINSSGLIEPVNTNLPRFDYDPITLAAKGLLIEESRANAYSYSSDYTQAYWTKAGIDIGTSSVQLAPDGVSYMQKIQELNTTGVHRLNPAIAPSVTSGTQYTMSVFAKKGERDILDVFESSYTGVVIARFNLTNGTAQSLNAIATAKIEPWPDGIYRCIVTATAQSTGTPGFMNFLQLYDGASSYTGTPGYGLYVWGRQFEAGAFATSYIPTTTTSLTRNADVVQMTGTNFSSWYNASEGTFAAEFIRPTVASGGFPSIIAARQAAANDSQNTIEMYADTTTISTLVRTTGVAGQFSQYFGASIGSVVNVVLAYKVNNFAVAYNGNAATDTLTGNLPTVDMLNIGYNTSLTSQVLNSHIQSIRFWPQRLTSAEVQAFSK